MEDLVDVRLIDTFKIHFIEYKHFILTKPLKLLFSIKNAPLPNFTCKISFLITFLVIEMQEIVFSNNNQAIS